MINHVLFGLFCAGRIITVIQGKDFIRSETALQRELTSIQAIFDTQAQLGRTFNSGVLAVRGLASCGCTLSFPPHLTRHTPQDHPHQ